jgi:DHA2 family multidrug resistance protein-like MFS transporter
MSISRGVPAPAIAAEFGLGIAAGVVFVRRCTGRANAVVDVDLFRIPLFSCSALTSAATYTAQGLAYVALPFFFQSALGMSPLEAGLLFTAWPAGIVLASAFVTKLLTRLSSGNLATIGLAILACGLTSYALIPGRPSILDILVRGAICGIGFGFFQAPNNAEMMTTAPADRATSASGFIAVVRVLGQTLGAGLAAVVFAAFASRVIDAATSALWCAVAAASLATFLSLLRLVGRRRSADAASQPVPHRTVVLVKA